MGEGRRKRRRRVEPTDDWKQLKLLFGGPEQVRYEELRPLVLFGGIRSPREVPGRVTGVRYRKEDLDRAFFSTRFSRTLDSLGYARFRDWRVYGEEGLAKREAALWLAAEIFAGVRRRDPLALRCPIRP